MSTVHLPVLDKVVPHFEKSNVQFTTVSKDFQGMTEFDVLEINCTTENILNLQNADMHHVKEEIEKRKCVK